MSLAHLLLVASAAFAGMAATPVRSGPGGLRPPPRPSLVAAVAVGAAVLGGLGPGAPTGLDAADTGARGALAVAVVVLAARAPLGALLAASLFAAAAAAGSSLAWVPFAVLGALSALALGRARSWLVELVGAGALVQVALRLEPSAPLGSSVLAGLVLAPVVVWGAARLPPPARRRTARAAAISATLALAACASWAVVMRTAHPLLADGVRAATEGLEAAQAGDTSLAASRFGEASLAFASAERATRTWWARPVLALPVAGPNARAVEAMAAAGARVTAVASKETPAVDVDAIRLDGGAVPLDRVRALEPPLRRSAAVLGTAVARLRGASSPWLVPPVADRFERLLGRLERAQGQSANVHRVVQALPALLGGDGPRRYFVAMQTPSELRATGGLIGNFAELTAEGGRLRLDRVGRSADLNLAGDPAGRRLDGPPDFVRRYGSFHPESEWRNVNMSPHFPTVAEVIGALYPQSGGQAIDGVLSVDPMGLAALLEVVGPVPVAGLDEPLTAGNAGEVLLFEQYRRFQADNAERVEFLGAAAQSVWSGLTAGTLPAPPALGHALGPAFEAKHLLLSSRHADEQRLFEALGVDGGLPGPGGDSLAVITQNAGGNKVDWFLRRSLRYQVDLDPASRRLTARLEVRLANGAPPIGLPDIVIGSSRPGASPGENTTYLSVFTPWSLESARVGDLPLTMQRGREGHHHVYSAFVSIPPQGTLDVSLVLSGRVPGDRHYRLEVFRQTTVRPDDLVVDVALPRGWRATDLDGLASTGGRRATHRAPLDADVRLGLSARRGLW